MSLIVLLLFYTLISFDRIQLCRWVPFIIWHRTIYNLLEAAADLQT